VSTETLSTAPALPSLKQQARAFWRSRAARERQALALGGVALVAVLVWLIFVQPAWRTVSQAPAHLDRLDHQLQQLQAMSDEVRALRSVSPISAPQAAAALRAATTRLGEQARLSLQGDRASVTFTAVDSDDLRDWLNEVRSAARARPIEASLSRVADGYSGTVVVILGGGS
jgi:general secretion pathway protein M